MFTPPARQKRKEPIDVSQASFPKGYVSTLADSRTPADALVDMTNMTLEQDSIPRPRPPLVPYGSVMLGTCIGIGTFHKMVAGVPEKWEISMQVITGAGKVHIRKDGGAWTAITGTFDDEAWTTFTQIGRTTSAGAISNRVYISNAVDNMSYYDIDAGTIVTYSALSTPGTPTATRVAALVGTNFTYYYKISANNAVGETAASASDNEQVLKERDLWIAASEYIDVTWSAVAGATSYNVYMGDASGSEVYLTTVTGLTFRDDGTVAPNTFRLFPGGNSTAGPKLKNLVNSNNQLFGVGDPDNPSYLWYSGTGGNAGDFSPFNGGGYVGINYGGDSIPVAVRAFRDGKGNPVVTVLSRGSAGAGRLHHVAFQSQTIGDTVLVVPNVYEANGQSGTTSPLAVVEANNSIYYPTGTAFKSTGTKPNVINILSTDNISQQLVPDVQNLNLAAMDKAVGLEYENKIYWSLPVGSSTNNEIWILDLSRNGLWILRWPVSAKYMWLYEDNSGITHHCVLTEDNMVGEFTRSGTATTDFGTAFRTRLATGSMVFDKAGVTMAAIEKLRLKLLYPKGSIQINVYGLGEDGAVAALGSETYTQTVSFTGWGQLLYSDGYSMYSDDIGVVDFYSSSVAVIPVEVDEVVNELKTEVITEGANCDYFLSAVHTKGWKIPGLYFGD